MSNIPSVNEFNGPSVTEQGFKSALEKLIIYISELRPYVDSLVIGANDEAMKRILKDAIDAAAGAGAGANGWTDLLIQTEGGGNQRAINNRSVKNGDYPAVLGSPVRLKVITEKASLLYGINDPLHLDDNLNNFRGLNNPNAWHDSNIPIGSVAFGRNNVPFAYLTLALGHDCVAYGVASLTGGAGSCTGNPDEPGDGANYGYCSFAYGKDTQARGRISNAMGWECLSNGRFTSTDGYKCEAGPALATHPNGVVSEGAAARAHGYESKAFGNFAFAYGTNLIAYNGSQVIGRGINSGSPLALSRGGLGLGFGVDVPTIFCAPGEAVNGAGANLGFNTDTPMHRYDFRFKKSQVLSWNIEASGSSETLMAHVVNGTLGNGQFGELHKTVHTHPNAGQPYGVTVHFQNGVEYQRVHEDGSVKLRAGLEIGGHGLSIGGKRVLGGQLPPLADLPPTATLPEVIARLNEMLAGDRAHGFRAT